MQIVVAPTTFKGSIGVMDICIGIIHGIRDVYPEASVVQFPLSDGGDGFLECLLFGCGGEFVNLEVTGPTGKMVSSLCGILNSGTGVVEMAKASGLSLIGKEERNPLVTTSYGTGELIRTLVEKAVKKIIVGVGGSATIDMGVGCMQTLGVRFLDNAGKEVGYGGIELGKIKTIDRSKLYRGLRDVELVVAADVKNPLLGSEGAVSIYGKQKGLSNKDAPLMEDALRNVADVIEKEFGKDVATISGGGAAGGIAAGLFGILDAEIRSGADELMDITGFAEKCKDADLLITAEGKVDEQTKYGKVANKVLEFGKENGIFVLVLSGEITPEGQKLFEENRSMGFSVNPKELTESQAIERIGEFLWKGTANALEELKKMGMGQ